MFEALYLRSLWSDFGDPILVRKRRTLTLEPACSFSRFLNSDLLFCLVNICEKSCFLLNAAKGNPLDPIIIVLTDLCDEILTTFVRLRMCPQMIEILILWRYGLLCRV